MKNFLLSLLSFLSFFSAVAHPGTGIVMDRQGAIFYTDLAQVWRLAPDGRRTIAVPNVHTHELYLDPEGCLYGEHLWYEGELTGKWGHYVWRLHPGGTLDTLIGPKEGFREHYSFVRDAAGDMYRAAPGEPTSIVKVDQAGRVTTPAAGGFSDVRWMHATPAGTIYLIDRLDLKRITPDGRVHTLAADLAGRRKLTQIHLDDRHRLMGLWTDAAENVYVCDFGAGVVRRVSPAGAITVVARSSPGWSPAGGLSTPDGRIWLLEWSVDNRARVVAVGG